MHTLRFVALTLLAPLLAVGQNGATPKDWQELFNGRNLDGWVIKIAGHDLGDNYGDTFRVKDGVIQVSYDKYTEFGNRFSHLFYKQKFSHYLLSMEYRLYGEQ